MASTISSDVERSGTRCVDVAGFPLNEQSALPLSDAWEHVPLCVERDMLRGILSPPVLGCDAKLLTGAPRRPGAPS